MRGVTYKAKFVNKDKYLFDAVMFAGTPGVYTGMKAGAFSVSENQRFPEENPVGLIDNLLMLFQGYKEISWNLRETLINCEDYKCAYQNFVSTPLSSLGYIIVAGTKEDEGAIISRDRYGPAHIDSLNSSNGHWFLVQTNNDHWLDQGCFNRCMSATENMNKIGQANMDINHLRNDVLMLFPNLNHDTLYTTQFVPIQGFIDTEKVILSNDTDYTQPAHIAEHKEVIPTIGKALKNLKVNELLWSYIEGMVRAPTMF